MTSMPAWGSPIRDLFEMLSVPRNQYCFFAIPNSRYDLIVCARKASIARANDLVPAFLEERLNLAGNHLIRDETHGSPRYSFLGGSPLFQSDGKINVFSRQRRILIEDMIDVIAICMEVEDRSGRNSRTRNHALVAYDPSAL